jgi:hypothetical protein
MPRKVGLASPKKNATPMAVNQVYALTYCIGYRIIAGGLQ